MFRSKPSFWKAFAVIEIASHFSVFLITANVLALAAWYLTHKDFDFLDLIVMDLILILFFLIVSAWRYIVMSRVFTTGLETSGKIVGVYFWMGLGYITYEYLFSSRIYRSTESIRKRGKAKELRTGHEVMLFVNPKKPLQIFNRDLYL